MGKSTSVDELVRKFDQLAKVVKGDSTETVKTISQFMKDRALDLARDDLGSDLRFRNNNKRPVGVGYDLKPTADGAVSEIRARGPFSWLEYGIASHAIVPGGKTKKFRGITGTMLGGAAGPALPVSTAVGLGLNRGKGRGKLMVWNNKGAAAWFITKSGELPEKQTWSNAKEQTQAAAGELARRQFIRSGAKVIT